MCNPTAGGNNIDFCAAAAGNHWDGTPFQRRRLAEDFGNHNELDAAVFSRRLPYRELHVHRRFPRPAVLERQLIDHHGDAVVANCMFHRGLHGSLGSQLIIIRQF